MNTYKAKKTRLSYQQVCKIIDAWNAERGLKYLDKGFLMLHNDGNHHFLSQISKQGETCVDSIATDGSLRDCLNSMYRAENNLLEK